MIRYILLAAILPLLIIGNSFADHSPPSDRVHTWHDDTQTWLQLSNAEGVIRGQFYINEDNDAASIELCDDCAFNGFRFAALTSGDSGSVTMVDASGVTRFMVEYTPSGTSMKIDGLPSCPTDPDWVCRMSNGNLRVSQ